MDIHEDITVTLPYWKWIFFLGWVEAHCTPEEHVIIADVVADIAGTTVP